MPENWRQMRAIDFAEQKLFPKEWSYLGVRGKDAFKKNWQKEKKRLVDAVCDVRTYRRATGLGVVTGTLSGGLVAIDIDGPEAEFMYEALATGQRIVGSKYPKEWYEPYGKEKTMAWTSGKEGRRQILYRIPEGLVNALKGIKTLTCTKIGMFFRPDERIDETWKMVHELVIRYDECMSVLPGSIHPETKKRYQWLSYNGGMPAEAPKWLIDVMLEKAKPQVSGAFLDKEDLDDLRHETHQCQVPPKQIRGWFFSDKVQSLLRPRLEELIFKHPEFDKAPWVDGSGDTPQRQNGCPWHESSSRTAFQYSPESGKWYCHACKVGGDVLDFVHKIRTDDMNADQPDPLSLETYVSEIAPQLGFTYPDDLLPTSKTTAVPRLEMSSREFLDRCRKIIADTTNPAEQSLQLEAFAQQTVWWRQTPAQIRERVARDDEFQRNKNGTLLRSKTWMSEAAPEEYLIPGFLRRPSQVLLHARGGVGKTDTALALAKAIGRGEVLNIRGLDVQCQKGNVLWISGDQSETRLALQLLKHDINPSQADDWFHLVTEWKIDLPSVFTDLIKQVKPALVVIDSLSAVSDIGDVSENEGAYAAPLYSMARRNGAESAPGGFPSCAIVWIHHNTKSGDSFRGTDRILNAVDESWELFQPDEQQEEEFGPNARVLKIGKSRYDRSGDRLLVERDHNLTYTLRDLTPTLWRQGRLRNGDLDPSGVVLEVLRGAEEGWLTLDQVRDGVKEYVLGEGRDRFPKRTAVFKYLQVWVTDGLVEAEEVKSSGRGRPSKRYRLARVEREKDCELIDWDNRDSWPRALSEFIRDTMRPANKFQNEPSVNKKTGVEPGGAPEGGGNLFTEGAAGNLFTVREQNTVAENPCETTVPEDAGNLFTESPGLHAREEADSGDKQDLCPEEGSIGEAPEGEEGVISNEGPIESQVGSGEDWDTWEAFDAMFD
ncbi:MAG: hypothetical protein ER33_08980 [Cyanobium sp. CACIAM 14]|nr:MAG: hypothetical protein ER33_08980 [Cyanobium sp. CACIAM 14]